MTQNALESRSSRLWQRIAHRSHSNTRDSAQMHPKSLDCKEKEGQLGLTKDCTEFGHQREETRTGYLVVGNRRCLGKGCERCHGEGRTGKLKPRLSPKYEEVMFRGEISENSGKFYVRGYSIAWKQVSVLLINFEV